MNKFTQGFLFELRKSAFSASGFIGPEASAISRNATLLRGAFKRRIVDKMTLRGNRGSISSVISPV